MRFVTSSFGTKRTWHSGRQMSAIGGKADIEHSPQVVLGIEKFGATLGGGGRFFPRRVPNGAH
jgi:hypothetical protein